MLLLLYSKGETSLHIASTTGNTEVIGILLEMGADPTIRGPQGSCLEIAIRGGFASAAVIIKNKGSNAGIMIICSELLTLPFAFSKWL